MAIHALLFPLCAWLVAAQPVVEVEAFSPNWRGPAFRGSALHTSPFVDPVYRGPFFSNIRGIAQTFAGTTTTSPTTILTTTASPTTSTDTALSPTTIASNTTELAVLPLLASEILSLVTTTFTNGGIDITATLLTDIVNSTPTSTPSTILPTNATTTLLTSTTTTLPTNGSTILSTSIASTLPANVTAPPSTSVTTTSSTNVTAILPTTVITTLPNNLTTTLPTNVTAALATVLPANVTTTLSTVLTTNVSTTLSTASATVPITIVFTTLSTTVSTTLFTTLSTALTTNISTTLTTSLPTVLETSVPTTLTTIRASNQSTTLTTTLSITLPTNLSVTNLPTTVLTTLSTALSGNLSTTLVTSLPTTLTTTLPTTSNSSAPTTVCTTTATPPAATDAGVVSGCTEWYIAELGDTCYTVAPQFDISIHTFIVWNPSVGGTCRTMLAGHAYCVASCASGFAETMSLPASSTTLSSDVVRARASTSASLGNSSVAATSTSTTPSTTPFIPVIGPLDVYRTYTGDGSVAAGWPSMSQWVNFTYMFEHNRPNMLASCAQWDVALNSEAETDELRTAILSVGAAAKIDPRFILAIVMQESTGCVRVITTVGAHNNPGLMQSYNGTGTCNPNNAPLRYLSASAADLVSTPCPATMIRRQIEDGTIGTVYGPGLAQDLIAQNHTDVSRFYRAARIYNGGSLQADGNLTGPCCTPSYASDVANRLTGWVNAPHDFTG